MRDPNRIHSVILAIERILVANPKMTIGKLIVLAGGDPAVYYIEDNDLITIISSKTRVPTEKLTEDYPIEPNLYKLETLWKKYPDLRFGQLICNVITDTNILNMVSDTDLVNVISEAYGGLNGQKN